MESKKWPMWLKGGVIFLIFPIISLFCNFAFSGERRLACLPISYGFLIFDSGVFVDNIVNFVLYFVFGVIIGGLLGLIVYWIKEKVRSDVKVKRR